MLLIILYHFLEINAVEEPADAKSKPITSSTPLVPSSWIRHGPVFRNLTSNSKSGALLIRNSRNYLYWGDTSIKVATSTSLLSWPQSGGEVLIHPRVDFFDSRLVESGPPPLLLSSGDWLLLYNSAQLG